MADLHLIEDAPAKINLDLIVTNRRSDGYHELDSLVVFANIGDELHIGPSHRLELEICGRFADRTPGGEDNIVLRAARLLAETYDVKAGAKLVLEKRLPVAAGIGGGSSDAGAALRGLNRFWQLGLSISDLAMIGAELGADVPVCTYAAPARMRGVGERIDPVRGLPDMPLVLINPLVEVPTGAVFSQLNLPLEAVSRPPFRANPSLLSFATWLSTIPNELQPAAVELAPEISAILDALGAIDEILLARMSGSGATCFALLADERAAQGLAERFSKEWSTWWVVSAMAPGQP